MLKLAVFNSIKYSFNKKTWVSDRATVHMLAGCLLLASGLLSGLSQHCLSRKPAVRRFHVTQRKPKFMFADLAFDQQTHKRQ